jgi:hypothetical protein
MTAIRRFDILSVGITLGILYALLGFIVGGVVTMIALVAGAAANKAGAGGGGGLGAIISGVGAIVIIPVFYGVLGFIGGIISALIYNVIASFTGGIKFELVDERNKRYHDESDEM